jgi:hypothetical protein
MSSGAGRETRATDKVRQNQKRQLSLNSFSRVEKHGLEVASQSKKPKITRSNSAPASTTKRQQELIEREVNKMEKKWLMEQNLKKQGSSTEEKQESDTKERVVVQDDRPFLHANVQYKVEGHATNLTEAQAKVFAWVKVNYDIPSDFDINHKYGALSGVSHEERVNSAYMFKLIEPKNPSEMPQQIKMCTSCGEDGHFFTRCSKSI